MKSHFSLQFRGSLRDTKIAAAGSYCKKQWRLLRTAILSQFPLSPEQLCRGLNPITLNFVLLSSHKQHKVQLLYRVPALCFVFFQGQENYYSQTGLPGCICPMSNSHLQSGSECLCMSSKSSWISYNWLKCTVHIMKLGNCEMGYH